MDAVYIYDDVSRCGSHFTGKERDAETGLDYFGARYYGFNMGRFITPDPQFVQSVMFGDPQSWSLYGYVGNNPLRYVDPTGRLFWRARVVILNLSEAPPGFPAGAQTNLIREANEILFDRRRNFSSEQSQIKSLCSGKSYRLPTGAFALHVPAFLARPLKPMRA